MTRCFSRLTIPSTAALRLSSRTLPTLPRPRPLTVSRTRRLVLMGLPTSLTRILLDIGNLNYRVLAQNREQNLESRAERALQSDPHLHPLPNRERGKKEWTAQSSDQLRPRSRGGFGMVGGAAAETIYILGAAEFGQRLERRLDQVVRIRRAQALGQDVADARELDHGAHAARRDDAGALGRRPQHDASGAETSDHFVRNGTVLNRHPHQAFLGAIDTLANRLGHFVGLAETESDQAVVIAGDHQRAEAEAASALHDFRDAVDMHDLLLDLEALRIDPLRDRAFPERSLPAVQNFNPASRAASASALTRP